MDTTVSSTKAHQMAARQALATVQSLRVAHLKRRAADMWTWLTTNALYVALAALLGVSTFAGVQTLRLAHAETEIANQKAAISTANEKAEKLARDTGNSIIDLVFGADASYQRGLKDAQDNSDRIVSDLNAGNLKLRREWAGCETGRLADNTAFAITAGEAERRRNESAGRIVRATDECVAATVEYIALYNGIRDKLNGAKQ